ncbi:hypothetical protein [Micromonospora saelicesensis]|uniref:Uncharacterized protein n=1 Tax=Micromonospora saelicesensis TaxID=285676 RepID=A0A1C4Z2T9_9ACTN|nr:hypothetical protein [Micromonospora saelicesensis]SCF27342.1 hypothetical protein GA0070561_4863 [Micromonospora saelicesensis]
MSSLNPTRPDADRPQLATKTPRLLATAVTLLLTAAALVVTTTSAQAASGCRSAPYSATFGMHDSFGMFDGLEDAYFPRSGSYRTTSQCRDIQVRNTGNGGAWGGPFWACVVWVGRATCSNGWTYVPAGQWRNLATNVKDGTRFYLFMQTNLGTYNAANGVGEW